MFNMKRLSGAVLTIAVAVALSACGTTTISQVRDGKTAQPVWPTVDKAHPLVAETTHPQAEALRKIVPGTPKLEIYRLIGHPMYREGIAGVHEWDYVFKLPVPDKPGQEMTCQYKVLFDGQMLSKEMFWNPAGCADLIGPPKPAPVQAPHVAAATEVSADFLFDFDSAKLSAEAPAAIDEKVIALLDAAERVDTLRVLGYTDRMGSDAYNMKLSRDRADAVKRYMVSRGIPAEAIYVEGRGKADPQVQCDQKQREALIACLKPNRRVRIELVAR